MDIKSLEADLQSTLSKARDLASQADSRPFSDEEKSQMEDTLAKAREIRSRLDEAKDSQALKESVMALGEGLTDVTKEKKETMSNTPKSIGDAFVAHHAYKSLINERGLAGIYTSGPVEFDGKSTVTEESSAVIAPQSIGGVVDLRGTDYPRPRIADLFAQGSTDSNLVRYTKEKTATNNASAVAEAAEKPESYLEFELADSPVVKVASTLAISDEMLADSAQLATYINERLRTFVAMAEDDMLLNGSGTPGLVGILNQEGIQDDISDSNMIDAVYRGITAVRVETELEPDAMVIHPNSWADLRLSVDDNGVYRAGGPFSQMAGDFFFGLRVVTTPRIDEGSVLVGAWKSGAQLFRRGGLTLEATNSHGNNFVYNITTLRAEERLALAVYRPAAFAVCSVGA